MRTREQVPCSDRTMGRLRKKIWVSMSKSIKKIKLTKLDENGRASGGLLKVILRENEHSLVPLDVLESTVDAGEDGGEKRQRCQ